MIPGWYHELLSTINNDMKAVCLLTLKNLAYEISELLLDLFTGNRKFL